MGLRRWHIEHADGREWTDDELAKTYGSDEAHFVLSEWGNLGVLFTTRACIDTMGDVLAYDWDGPAVNSNDMVVVWDG